MNPETRSRVYAQLKIDEGVKYEIYLDHLGFKTFGIGHLCTPDDPEFEQGTATPVSPQRVRECFENDQLCIRDSIRPIGKVKLKSTQT